MTLAATARFQLPLVGVLKRKRLNITETNVPLLSKKLSGKAVNDVSVYFLDNNIFVKAKRNSVLDWYELVVYHLTNPQPSQVG